jgi:hypothetical protein
LPHVSAAGGSQTFYATVATILPLFVLTLTATNRFGVRDDSEAPGADAAIGIGLICAAAIGEFSALDALASDGTHSLRLRQPAATA